MKLRVLLPEHVAVDRQVVKINAEGRNGEFCLLPHHVDFVAALVPGLLSFTSEGGGETFLAVDQGTLVKQGDQVLVSTPRAISGRPLGALRTAVEEEIKLRDEQQRRAQTALGKIEADLVRRLVELSGVDR